MRARRFFRLVKAFRDDGTAHRDAVALMTQGLLDNVDPNDTALLHSALGPVLLDREAFARTAALLFSYHAKTASIIRSLVQDDPKVLARLAEVVAHSPK